MDRRRHPLLGILRAGLLALLILMALPVTALARPGDVSIIVIPAGQPHVGDELKLSWEFELGGSFDPKDWVAVEQKWDLDGDGKYDDASGSDPNVTFATAGKHTVGVHITYDCGFEEKIRETIKVLPTAAAVPAPSVAPVAPPPPPPAPTPPPRPASPPPPAPPAPSRAPSAASQHDAAAPATARAATPQARLTPFPVVRMRGSIGNRSTRITELSVKTGRGSIVKVRCHGKGCPVLVLVVRASSNRVLRLRMFERRLAAGAVLEVVITKKDQIGKYTRFIVRRSGAPARTDACAAAGSGERVTC